MPLRRLVPLFLLIVAAFTIMTYQSNKGALMPGVFLSDPLSHLNDFLHSVSQSLRSPFRKIALRDEENMRLKQENARLLLEQQRHREIFFENQRLREMLSLKEREPRYVTTARVISKAWDRWATALTIDKGSTSGIGKDMAVITPRGLIGKVTSVTDRYAQVLLITDINFSTAVRAQETRKEAILSGTGSRDCILKYVPHEETFKEGDVVVTSGFDDLFPPEVPVGSIGKTSHAASGIFQQVEVRPFQNLKSLDEVVVIAR